MTAMCGSLKVVAMETASNSNGSGSGTGPAVAPPRLAPVSGVLSQGQGVIKPIACRPVISSANTTPILGNRTLSQNGTSGGSRTLYNSTSDLHSPPQQQLSSGKLAQHLQRFSWSKGPPEEFTASTPVMNRPIPQQSRPLPTPPQQQKEQQQQQSPQQQQQQNGAVSINGRVADLSRRFGGSLSSVAAPPLNSPNSTRQPPAYRPPPSSRSSVKGREGGYSSSELHLDRVASLSCARPSPSSGAPQWVLGGSEVNLSCLSRSTLPRKEQSNSESSQRHHQLGGGHNHSGGGGLLLSAYEPLNHRHHPASANGLGGLMSASNSRSSWAGLPSSANALSCFNGGGSVSTLANSSFDSRRDDTATPIVEEGRIRSILSGSHMRQQQQQQNQRDRKHSAGSLDEDFDCLDGSDSAADGTPSPSDSGVAELEALLKEKDCEIALLRETLEQNEAVIFQVYQEKEKSWERELKKLRSIYEERMRTAQQTASQAERALQTQAQQWQSEKKQLKQQIQQLKAQCEQVQGRLDETSWTLCQKSGEMALVRSQLKEAQTEQSQRCQEMAKLRAQLKETQETAVLQTAVRQRMEKQLDRRSITSPVLSASRKLFSSSNSPASSPDSSDLKSEMQRLQRRLVDQQQSIEAERQVWHEEKATVLVYQRHLQQQYVQAMKRNQQLEEALGLLGITGVSPQQPPQQLQKQPLSSPKSNCSDPITIDLDSSSNSSTSETHC